MFHVINDSGVHLSGVLYCRYTMQVMYLSDVTEGGHFKWLQWHLRVRVKVLGRKELGSDLAVLH